MAIKFEDYEAVLQDAAPEIQGVLKSIF